MTTYPAQYGLEEFIVPNYSLNEESTTDNVFSINILDGECAGETLSILNVSMGDTDDASGDGVLEFDLISSVGENDSKYGQITEIAQNILKSAIYFALDNAREINNEDVAS